MSFTIRASRSRGSYLIFKVSFFSGQILPVVITIDDANKPFTVYSVKTVDPQTIRTYGVVRYTDSVEQAKAKNIPISGIMS